MTSGIERTAIGGKETRHGDTGLRVYLPFPGNTIVANVVSRECAARDRGLYASSQTPISNATVSLRRPISRRRRDAPSDSRVFLFDRLAAKLADDSYTYRLSWRARAR